MASLIPGYEYDIFISYRQKDNKVDGWVTEFVNILKRELESMFKDEVSVYFDIYPSDYLLESYDVDASLKDKLKCLIFMPIISRTYCDPKSFAWDNELKAFIEIVSKDKFGFKIKLSNGNVANRVLPIRIHDLDVADTKLFESVVGGVMRSIDFVYKETGVNRQLRAKDDDIIRSTGQILYRDQINKVALAVKEIIESMKISENHTEVKEKEIQVKEKTNKVNLIIEEPLRKIEINSEQKAHLQKFETVKPKFIPNKLVIIVIVSIILILGIPGTLLYFTQKKRNYARFELIPQIRKMLEDNYTAPFKTFEFASEAEKYIPNDSILINLWPQISKNISFQTQPEGAQVSCKDYNRHEDSWNVIGVTPFQNIRIPVSYKRIKIEKDGFQTVFITDFNLIDLRTPLKLDSIGLLPKDMVRIPSRIIPISIIGLERTPAKGSGEFLVDRFEVTNKDYQQFVDSDGYNKKQYWHYPFYLKDTEISWESAMNIFVDKTGKHGPADWEVGNYPVGKENYPVTGISWYEASAYAMFAGKKLPTVFHWNLLAETSHSMNIIPLSNFDGKSTVPVGSMEGISSYGLYDLAGNVREWCHNGNGINGESYILGGGWNDPIYAFNDAGTQPSIDRSLTNGFRCIKLLQGDTTFNSLSDPIEREYRNYSQEKPVDDKTFNIFLRQYAYDKSPLNVQLVLLKEIDSWKVEKVTIDAGYNNERLDVYIFLPKNVKPPYQPVIYFPGSNAISTSVFKITDINFCDFLIKSGRVLVYPILKGTYERKDELKNSLAEETVLYKDHVIMWRKDIGRTIDYLETRNDILSDKLGYLGLSWGGRLGGLFPAVEKRIKAVVLHVGGMSMNKTFPEVDPLNFLTRIYQPVLMLNGKYDMYFPVETSQMPMYNLLGTPEKDKKILIYDTGHLVPRTDLIKECLAWYDKYLGPVKLKVN